MRVKIEYAEPGIDIDTLEIVSGDSPVQLLNVEPDVQVRLFIDGNATPYIILISSEGSEQFRATNHTYYSTKIQGVRIIIKVIGVEKEKWAVALSDGEDGIWHDIVEAESIQAACAVARVRNQDWQEVVSARKLSAQFVEPVYVALDHDMGLGTVVEGVYRSRDQAVKTGDEVCQVALHNES